MKHQWMAYVIVAVLSIGAGVAIAGLPNNVPVDATIIPPTTTEAPAPTTTEAPTTTTEAPTTTAAPATTEAPTTTEAEVALPDRSEIVVGVANGAGIAGTAARNAVRLTDLGYVDVIRLDGTEIVEFTTIYFADGFEEAAVRLALDLELLETFVAPLADAPTVNNLTDDIELLAYIGIDRAN